MLWTKIILFAVVCISFAMYQGRTVNDNAIAKTKLATQQLIDDGSAAEELKKEHIKDNNMYTLGWVAIFLVGLIIFIPDLKRAKQALLLTCLSLVMVTSSGCWRPFEPIVLEDVKTNEEAFLLPFVGNTKDQVATSTEEYLQQNMVHVKQVKIPQQWVQRGYETFGANGEWKDAAILVKVDKSPVTREWTADENSGTSNKNEAIWVMTSDQVEFSTGWTCTARIASKEDAVKFLHNYPNGSLAKVLDEEVRLKLNARFGIEVTDLPMEKLRLAATPHIETVSQEIIEFFKERGITITNLGITGGFVYKDKTIQSTMVELFIAEQQKAISAAATQAQEEKNKRMLSEAKAKADAILQEKQAEAKGIQAVAEAKAFEMEKAKEDTKTYMELKRLEVANKQLEKWDGKFPMYFMGNANPTTTLLPLPTIPEIK